MRVPSVNRVTSTEARSGCSKSLPVPPLKLRHLNSEDRLGNRRQWHDDRFRNRGWTGVLFSPERSFQSHFPGERHPRCGHSTPRLSLPPSNKGSDGRVASKNPGITIARDRKGRSVDEGRLTLARSPVAMEILLIRTFPIPLVCGTEGKENGGEA